MPEISIIVPVYRVEKYLDRCVNSILNQTFTDFELILVDDGSPDRCPVMCDEWEKKDHRIKVIHKGNGGASSARNAGLDVACGKFIGFVDSDDWIEKDMYELLHTIIMKHNADIAMCDFTSRPQKLELGMGIEGVIELDKNRMQELFYRIHGESSRYSVWNCLYNAQIIKDVRFIKGLINEDVMFTYEAYIRADKLVFSEQKKYLYFKNSDGVTRSRLCTKDVSLLKIWDEIVRQEKGKTCEKYAKHNRMRATFTLYAKALIYGCNADFDRTILKEWKTELKKNREYLLKEDYLDIKRKMFLILILIVR
ncbi:MAG: glycosyltransferase [Roseburia sp.]|nr:glycosyltransferase [Roseburia sp.]